MKRKPIAFRVMPVTDSKLNSLARRAGISRTAVVERLIVEAHRQLIPNRRRVRRAAGTLTAQQTVADVETV